MEGVVRRYVLLPVCHATENKFVFTDILHMTVFVLRFLWLDY